MAEQLKAWEKARTARLHHVIFQLSKGQLQTVELAMERAIARSVPDGSNPNRRGQALYMLCREYLEALEEVPE